MNKMPSLLILFLLHFSFSIFAQNPWIDTFGNVLVYLDKNEDQNHQNLLQTAIKLNQDESRAIAVYGGKYSLLTKHFANHNVLFLGKLSEDLNTKDLKVPKSEPVHLIRYSSSISETIIINERPYIRSGHMAYYFNHDQKTYALVVKDRTKAVLVIPGGTQNRDEYLKTDREDDLLISAIRELEEEGGVNLKKLSDKSFKHIIEIDSTRGLLGLTKIEDQCRIYGIKDENPFAQPIIKQLFSSKATVDNNDTHKLIIEGNNEIDYIAAIPVPTFSQPPKIFTELVDYAKTMVSSIDGVPISLLSRISILQAIYPVKEQVNYEEAKKAGLGKPIVISYTFLH